MSSDTFHINVLEIDNDKVEFLCHTSTAGGFNDYAITRSFALMIIEDGMPYASDGKGTPLQREMRALAGSDTPPVWEEKFHKEHVAKFIASAKLISRHGIIRDEAAWRVGRFEKDDDVNYPLHSFVFHVQVTDPKWLEGLKKGARYGTTAFDAWWDDPMRQSPKALAAIEKRASIWKPPSEKKASKTNGTAGQTAAKRSPAKRSAVKKGVTPVKKAAKKTTSKA